MDTLKRDSASRPKESTIPASAKQSEVNEVCPLCGRTATAPQVSIREALLNAVSVAVLLAILVPTVWLAEQWLERMVQRAVDSMIWREPVESWNQ